MRLTLTLAAALAASTATAGGLAPSTSPAPFDRPTYAPIMEPERCERPVYGRDGATVLYWTGRACVAEVIDGGNGDQPRAPEPENRPEPEPPTVVEKPDPEPEKPEPEPCKARKLGGGC